MAILASGLQTIEEGGSAWRTLHNGNIELIDQWITDGIFHEHRVNQLPLAGQEPDGARVQFTITKDGSASPCIAGSAAVYYEGNRMFSTADYAEHLDGDGLCDYITMTFAVQTGERLWWDPAYPASIV